MPLCWVASRCRGDRTDVARIDFMLLSRVASRCRSKRRLYGRCARRRQL